MKPISLFEITPVGLVLLPVALCYSSGGASCRLTKAKVKPKTTTYAYTCVRLRCPRTLRSWARRSSIRNSLGQAFGYCSRSPILIKPRIGPGNRGVPYSACTIPRSHDHLPENDFDVLHECGLIPSGDLELELPAILQNSAGGNLDVGYLGGRP